MGLTFRTRAECVDGPNVGSSFVNEGEQPELIYFCEWWKPEDPWWGTMEDEWANLRLEDDVDLGEDLMRVISMVASPYTRFHFYRLDSAFAYRYLGWEVVNGR